MKFTRSSGVQLHVTSLPGGRLGPQAYRFVDWLEAAGQVWGQGLPLGPPDPARGPYKNSSAVAAWPGLLPGPSASVSDAERDAFGAKHAFWIEDWASFAGGRRAVDDQVRFDREWGALRAYAADRGVRLIGDVPIYVAPGSADHAAHPELFRDDVVAGAPPDYFSSKGQLWGNPIYDWPALRRRRYRWWVERFRRIFDLFDVVRIDHFRGFVAYWAVPEDAPDGRSGRGSRGPGRAPYDAALAELGELPCIAEDLGVITPPVTRLRRELGFPGIVVLQFAFDPDDPRGPHRPENHREDVVAYTGTHDTDTLRGWWNSLDDARRDEAWAAVRAAGVEEDGPGGVEFALIRMWMRSVAPLVMLQVQDVLGLGSEARVNFPGRGGGAWKWWMEHGALTADHARRLRAATEEAGRGLWAG